MRFTNHSSIGNSCRSKTKSAPIQQKRSLIITSTFILTGFALLFSIVASSASSSILSLSQVHAFYLPGVAPKEFQAGEEVPMKVNKLTSIKTQLPYEYYSLPVCKPGKVEESAENLGEVLGGDRIKNSLYKFYMKRNSYCNILCKKEYGAKEIKLFQERIKDDYRVHWIMDNMPASIRVYDEENPDELHYERGFPLGIINEKGGSKDYYLYNHIRFTVKYHEDPTSFSGARVIAFEVEPFTVKHKFDSWPSDPAEKPHLDTCNDKKKVDHTMMAQGINGDQETVVWTYDVLWETTDTPWSKRWDVFLNTGTDDQIHWFSIVNSLMIVLFLTGMVAMIMIRTLHKDISKYNEEPNLEDAQEETGWKLVHGDVFRPPQFSPMLLAVFAGTGVQISAMTLLLVIAGAFGFLSPASRGSTVTAILIIFVFMGSFAGYWAARLYKMFGGKAWKRNTMLTALLYPGICFLVMFVVNLFVWHSGSSGAVPFGTMLALIVLWFGISVPLVLLGSYFGFKKPEIEPPVSYNQIPRQIPEQAWYMNPMFSVMVGGILPFGAVFIEMFFILSSVWLHQIYYVFGFALIVLLILVLTCAEISIVLVYFQLCSEDYHWWWRSFMTSGSSAAYLFAYSILYFVTKLDMSKFAAVTVFFGYMWLVSFTFFLLTGSIGFFACFLFIRKIFSSIKVD